MSQEKTSRTIQACRRLSGQLYICALFLVMSGLLTYCTVVRSEQSKDRLENTIASLPQPQGVALLDEVTGIGGGSDKTCYTAYLYRLYGSDETATELISFYEETLLSEGGWEKIDLLSSSQDLTLYNRDGGYRLSVYFNLRDSELPNQSIASALARFSTPYVLAADHADAATRKKCWPGWED